MFLLDYFDEMKLILEIVKDNPNIDFQKLLDISLSYKEISKYIKSGKNEHELIKQLNNASKNLIDEGYIEGKAVLTKDKIYFIMFNHLTTNGKLYLEKYKDKSFKNKAKKVLKEQGLPKTWNGIIKAIANLIW